MKNDIVCKLNASQPFIYKVNGSYYCIGSSVFYECNNEEVEAFNNMMDIFKDISLLKYDIEDGDVVKICQQYISIFGNREDHVYDSKRKESADNEIEKLISQLNETDIMDLEKQRDDRFKILNYVDRFRLNNDL